VGVKAVLPFGGRMVRRKVELLMTFKILQKKYWGQTRFTPIKPLRHTNA